MKNLLTLLLAFAFVIGMTACGGSATHEEHDEEATESVEGMESSVTEAAEEVEADTTEIEEDGEVEDDKN